MIKASAMFSAHAIHVLLRNTLIFFIMLFIALFFWLKVGIETDSLVLGHYKVEGLYLKLDKKLTLKTDKILIPKSKDKPSFENVDKTFDTIKYLFTFFDTIDLKNVTFEDNHINIIFTDDILYITSDDYEIAGNIHRAGQTLTANVSMLYLKKNNIKLKGNLSYDLKYNTLSTEGDFDAYNIKGSFIANKQDDVVSFKITSTEFTDLKTLIHTFALKEGVKSWIVGKVQAQKYLLNSLTGRGYITKNGFKIDFDTLEGDILFDGVKIYYQKSLEPILAKSFKLTYKNKALYFDLKDPVYKKRSLKGSKIAITGLGEKQTLLKLDLHMLTPIDNELQKILKSYHLDIPVKHKGKPVNVDLKMDIPLGSYAKKKKSKVYVNADFKQGDVWYQQVKLPLQKGQVKFNNQDKEGIKVSVTLKKGTVEIGKTKLPVLGGKGYYEKGIVSLDNVHIKESWYEGHLKGKINLKKKHASLSLDAKQISIGDKKKFIVLKNKKLPLTLDYNKNLRIDIPSLALKITNKTKDLHIEVEKIEKIKPYLKNIDLDIDGGNIDVLKQGESYTFKGELRRKACFLYGKNNLCYTTVPISGKVSKAELLFYAFGKRLYYNATKSRIKLKNLNIDLKKFLDARKEAVQHSGKSKKLVILGSNSKIRYNKYTLLTDSYDIEISPKGNIKALGSLDEDIVKFSKKGKIFSLKALRIKDKMLHPLIGFKGLKKGRYTLKQSGNPDRMMKGQIIVEGGIMSDFKAYNNTLALLNTIPALATLSNPGFSEKGFKVDEGVVEYRMIGDKVIFDSVYIKGRSATIVGKGELNLKNKTINMKLAIQTARELGKFVGNLPLLGYILMGKDKSMTVGLKITGSLSKPKVNTSAAQDILSLPLQIIKRTLESPTHIINK